MRRGMWRLVLFAWIIGMTGCYATSIDTGRPQSTKVIRKPYAACWIYGLIPPPTVQTAGGCPNGVAKVETQHSFLDMLIGGITLGVYTPIQIVVTCAEESHSDLDPQEADITVALNAPPDEVRQAFARAADEAVRTGRPVLVRRGQCVEP